MTADQLSEYEILMARSAKNEIAVPLNAAVSGAGGEALGRLIDRGWLRLVDVAPLPQLAIVSLGAHGMLYRIFHVSAEAVEWADQQVRKE